MYLLITIITKLTYQIIKIFRLGAGYTWPGHLALKLDKNILSNKKLYPSKGFVFISGTNGKTTTSKLISLILEKKGLKVVTNKSGANLLNGVASELILNTTLSGKATSDIGVFEVDEKVLPKLLEIISPRTLVLLNLSRDQLDRYGEIDIIVDAWESAISKLDKPTHLIFDSSQKIFESIPGLFKGRSTGFVVSKDLTEVVSLFGGHNSKNVSAALEVVADFGIDSQEALNILKDFKPAYGRGEIIEYRDTSFQIFLAKNPASINNNLKLLLSNKVSTKNILFVLNDGTPDGRDVSWIYDVDPLFLKEACEGKAIFVSGKRCFDMAARLMYAGVDVEKENIFEDLNRAIQKVSERDEVLVFPNYSAMLEVRKILTGKKIL
ncbi:MAG: MurT ligase domain-containing protein [Patescibacteria group bacterium]